MAETHQKRQREESHEAAISDFDYTNSKCHKSYDNILSILDEEEEAEEEEPNKDFSAIFTTLQQELSSSFVSPLPCMAEDSGMNHNQTTATSADCSSSSGGSAKEYKDDDSVRVMIRRLLEASDDELGIPNRVDEEIKAEGNRLLCDGLWELEDEAANYYTMLQKDLFI
ncbi:hypothetical protein Adt_29370 [Abeliophyllum distichum]|uniref:Uncharacterized protein n=1 Tax=Abeliophyllum distichum TaxID=126358 RepID=A0ABD1RBL9_9LAMI